MHEFEKFFGLRCVPNPPGGASNFVKLSKILHEIENIFGIGGVLQGRSLISATADGTHPTGMYSCWHFMCCLNMRFSYNIMTLVLIH